METLVANLGAARRVEDSHGTWLVAPMTLIVPGVLDGSKGPLYYPADEVARNYKQWDGYPLTRNHPTINGSPASAFDEGILDKVGMGVVRNPAIVDNKLVAEGWFHETRTKQVDANIWNALTEGRQIELSTGLGTENEVRNGRCPVTQRGYTAIARNYKPDHVAILTDGQRGACSINDGCGVHNQTLADVFNAFCPTGDGGGVDPTCGGDGDFDPEADKKDASWEDAGFLERATDKVKKVFGGKTDKEKYYGHHRAKQKFDDAVKKEIEDLESHAAENDLKEPRTGERRIESALQSAVPKILAKIKKNKSSDSSNHEDYLDEEDLDRYIKSGKLGDDLHDISGSTSPYMHGSVVRASLARKSKRTTNAIQSTVTGRFKPTGSGTGKGEIHEAAQAGALTFTDYDRELGATVRNDLSVIADEATWQRAKNAAGKRYNEDDDAHWSAAAAIYQRMGGAVRNECECGGDCEKCKKKDGTTLPIQLENAFCATGEGGGQDNSCGGSGSGGGASTPASHAKGLMDRAYNDMDLSYEDVTHDVNKHFSGLGKDELKSAAKEFGLRVIPGSKKATIAKIVDIIHERMAKGDRGNVIAREAGNQNAPLRREGLSKDRQTQNMTFSHLLTTMNADEGEWKTLPNGVHILVKDGEIVGGPKVGKKPKKGWGETILDTVADAAKALVDIDTHNEEPMNRDQAISHLTTNCDCWKGKKDLLSNKTHFTDDDITKLMTNFQAGQLAVNSLKEIGQAVGAPATLTINAMPAFVKEKVAAAPAAAKCPECGAAMADGKCPDCGYGAAAEPEAAPVGNKKRTTEQWIADAPPEAREMLNGLINNERTVKTSLITKIVANAKAGTKERLQKTLATKSVSELRDLVSLLPTSNQQTNDDPLTNYFGAGGGSNDIIVDNATSQADGVDYDGPWPGVVRMHAKTA